MVLVGVVVGCVLDYVVGLYVNYLQCDVDSGLVIYVDFVVLFIYCVGQGIVGFFVVCLIQCMCYGFVFGGLEQ